MELSEAFRFFKILYESFKLIYKTLKPISSIAAISLIAPSIIILLCSYIQFLTGGQFLGTWKFLVAEIIFLLVICILYPFTRVSTILVSATSYTDSPISLQQVFRIFKSTFKMQMKTSSYISRRAFPFAIVIIIFVTVIICKPNVTIVAIAVLIGVAGFIYQLYLSVVSAVAMVVSVIEEDCYATNAVERAKELVEGQQVHGFLMNVFLNLVVLLGLAAYWMAIGNIAHMNLTILILVLVNLSFLFQIFIMVAYTVFYFECKKHRGEEIESLRLHVQYSKLPTVATEE